MTVLADESMNHDVVERAPSETLARLRRGAGSIANGLDSAVRAPFRALIGLDPFERVFYGGLALLGVGLALLPAPWPPLGLIIPGAITAAVALLLKLRSP